MKKLIPLIVIAVILGGLYGYLQYNKEHRSVKDIKAVVKITSQELLGSFEKDEATSNTLYLDKVLEVKGIVKKIDQSESGTSIHLDAGNELSAIICEMDQAEDVSNIKSGQSVKIKGFCTGKLMDVVLVRCIFVK